MHRAGVRGWAIGHAERTLPQWRGAGFGSLAGTRVPQESLQRAPVLLLGTKKLPRANYINGCSQPGQRKGTVPGFPDVTPWTRTQPALALAGLTLASTARSCFPRLFGVELIFPFSTSQQGPSPRAKYACEALPPLAPRRAWL